EKAHCAVIDENGEVISDPDVGIDHSAISVARIRALNAEQAGTENPEIANVYKQYGKTAEAQSVWCLTLEQKANLFGNENRIPRAENIAPIRLCSKNSVNATSVTKSEISRFRSRRPLPPDPYCSAPTQPPPLAAAWPWQVIGKNAKLNRRRDTFVSEISEFRHRRRDSYSIFTDVLSMRASIEPAGALSIEPAGAYVPDSLPGYMIASSA
ncbi:MAG: hypothetical protein PUJ35_11685, partial [Ruminococcus bromii]|nr:hypothetical protein [Ruminococcus bromii]